MRTQLNDRTLWFDGDMTVKPSQLHDIINDIDPNLINRIKVDKIDDEIKSYNKLVSRDQRIDVKHECNPISPTWAIPEEYITINVLQYAKDKLDEHHAEEQYSEDEYLDRLERMATEYKYFAKLKMIPILRTLIFVINTFERDGVVWGPGRGSGVSSYLLYLLGVHDVDSVFFELEISDFIKHIKE